MLLLLMPLLLVLFVAVSSHPTPLVGGAFFAQPCAT